jgi:hypothetical protein
VAINFRPESEVFQAGPPSVFIEPVGEATIEIEPSPPTPLAFYHVSPSGQRRLPLRHPAMVN